MADFSRKPPAGAGAKTQNEAAPLPDFSRTAARPSFSRAAPAPSMTRARRENPGLALAARIRAAVERRRAEERAREEARRQRRERIQRATAELFEDLVATGEAAGVFEVEQEEEALTLTLDQRALRIEKAPTEEQPSRLSVRIWQLGEDAPSVPEELSAYRLSGYHQQELDRWVLRVEKGREDSGRWVRIAHDDKIFLTNGLAWLVERGLGLALDET